MRTRKAEKSDVERLHAITVAAKAHWGHDLSWVVNWVAAGDFASVAVARGEAWLIEIDGAISGWSALAPRGDVAWLEDLWVDPPYIGRGVGTELFLHAAARATTAGAHRLEWESDLDAVGFYERMGARRVRNSDVTELGRILPIMALDLS
jgi:N-acetylglutamate synthase-like GNAT family acetyltransferase